MAPALTSLCRIHVPLTCQKYLPELICFVGGLNSYEALQDEITLTRVCGPYTIVDLLQGMVYGSNFMVHLVLKGLGCGFKDHRLLACLGHLAGVLTRVETAPDESAKRKTYEAIWKCV